MMDKRLEHAFGEAPLSFEAAMRRSIEAAQPNKSRRIGARELLIAAVLMALLCGAAYAVVKGFGILDLLGIRMGVTPTAQTMVQTGIAQAGGTLESATFTLEQAISDGEMVYFTVRAALTNPDEAILMDEYQSPNQLVESGEDVTYGELAERTGKRLIRAVMDGVGVNDEAYPECQQIGAVRDGQDMVYAFYVMAKTVADQPLNLAVRLRAYDVYEAYESDKLERGTLTAQVQPDNRTVTHRWVTPHALPDWGIEITEVRVTDTPVIRFGEIHHRVLPTDDEAQLAIAHSAYPSILSEAGEPVDGMGGSGGELGDAHYVSYELLPPVTAFEKLVIGINGREALALDAKDAQKEEAK